ncbi:hypothetical protein A2Z00_02235 [Candidatus Gottesmanbacteria bacterium RBG_13_45_10]|uniref:Uncharacterized protein n=1 Tax=Candidatus Gottesmanbacteria bacterium RBG_13_45_10 TaxID=1798370 RepID=A0A1F5ZGM3_9BACT|nr:MAG: hypothetical protein A2Z00_02235 [Candidatus Gottesmanbacteria bacterium RBG_13_45_10]
MKNKKVLLFGILGLLLVVTGVVVYAVITKPAAKTMSTDDASQQQDSLPPVDSSIVVDLVKSKLKANTVLMTAKGLDGKIASVAYELSYESQGLIKGVNSGSKPIDTTGKDSFEREVYLGTCSKNDCKPDIGVSKVSVVLEFVDSSGKKSQFSKDYDL